MRYWAYVNNEILGPFEKDKLLELPSFTPSLLVCPQTPVGEKTEDWKEASTYPELSALIASGAGLTSRPVQAEPQPAPAAGPSASPAPAASGGFKSLTPSSVDPVPPAHNLPGGAEITVNKLGKSGLSLDIAAGGLTKEPQKAFPDMQAAAAPAPAPASSANFDPISLSTIQRRGEAQSPAPDAGMGKEQPKAFPEAQPPVSLELPGAAAPAPAPAPATAAAPVIETFARPAAAFTAPAADNAAMDGLAQKMEALGRSAATKQDLSSALDPFRMKLDQLGETVSSLKNPQFQREVMEKLTFLDNAIADIRSEMKALKSAAPAVSSGRTQEFKIERNSETVFGAQSSPKAEKPKPEPAKDAGKATVIVDEGSKSSKAGPIIKKLVKTVVGLVLLVAVLLGAVIGLKVFGVFDATGFIPFPLPFVSSQKAEPEAAEDVQAPAAQPVPAAAQQQAAPQAQAAAQASEQQPATPDLSPQIVYLARTYKLSQTGTTLENAVADDAARNDGDFNKVNWQVTKVSEGLYQISASVPSKTGPALDYGFLVNYDKKSVLPANDSGKAAFAALSPAKRGKKAQAKKQVKAAREPAPGQAAAAVPAAKKAAKKAPAAAQDEYEYVYEDEDAGGGQ